MNGINKIRHITVHVAEWGSVVCQLRILASSSARINFDIVTCVNQKNINELDQIRELLISKNVKAWRLFAIIPIGRAVHNPDLLLNNNQGIG